ncbi:MAG: COX15/CtaA family protein [Planctomycetes bacterium]|nr:COX15/CtaA family protein [Planctomycetota bacterium]
MSPIILASSEGSSGMFGLLYAGLFLIGVMVVILRMRSQTLALGFATTTVQWGLAYLAMMGPGPVVGDALFALTLAAPIAAGFVAARTLRDQASPVGVGLVSGYVNLLVVGGLVGGGSSDSAMITQGALWGAGMLVGSGLLAWIGGAFGSKKSAAWPWPAPAALFAIVACGAIFLLLITGGLVTGLEAGLAVPDWPNTFGHNMLLYPVSEMKGGVYYEHAHRLFGMLVGATTLTTVLVVFREDRRGWVRLLSIAALLMVCGQGLMGGLRVTGKLTLSQQTAELSPSILLAIAHGIFGQIVFATVALLAAVLTTSWKTAAPLGGFAGAGSVRALTLAAPFVLIVQLFLGASYRHLQIPPRDGHPAFHPVWAMHGHLGFSIVAILAVVLAASRMSAAAREKPELKRLGSCATVLITLLIVQVLLGLLAYVAVLMRKDAAIPLWELAFTSAHQATGALLFAAAIQGAAWTRRLVVTAQSERA